MKFIVDECTGPVVAKWLKKTDHDVFSVFDQARGVDDNWVLNKAIEQDRILITNDKDFGEMIYRKKLKHSGIILLRLSNESSVNKIKILKKILEEKDFTIAGHIIVATETNIRIIRFP